MGEQGERLVFLAERRALSVERFDTLHSPTYDEHWEAIDASHEDFVQRSLRRIPLHGRVLDAACGTGKYWPALLAARVQVMGVDQSGRHARPGPEEARRSRVRCGATSSTAISAETTPQY